MRFTTSLAGGLLSLSVLANADPTWPSKNDELEEIMYQVSGFNARQFGGTVIPCSNEASGPGRQNAAEWLRTGFHDMATTNINLGTGGLDGSLQFEVARGENSGPGFRTTLKFMSDYYTSRSSVADLIAMGVYYSVRSCGGPAIPVRGGRVDAKAADSIGVPLPENSVFTFQGQFARMGFSNTEMIQVVACGHTLGGVHATEFPTLMPPTGVVNDEAALDSTVAVFDNRVAVEYVAGNTTNPLVVGPSVGNGRNSDRKVFGSDNNVTITAMADPTNFRDVCKTVLQKMIEVVPPGVTLTDPILPYDVKPVNLQLTLQSGATTMALTGWIRVRTTVTPSSSISSLTLTYKDRNGGNSCGNSGCSATVTVQGSTKGFDDSFIWFPLNVMILTSTGISSFTLIMNMADGTKKAFDNNGASYPIQDAILIQKPQSCLIQFTGALTVTAAVRNDRNSLPVNLVVSQKVFGSTNPVATLSTNTTIMTKGTCIGPYTFYTADYTIPGNVTYSAKIDVVSGSGSASFADDFNAASELGGTCMSFQNPPTSMCTTGSVATSTPGSSSSTSSVTVSSTTSSSTQPATTLSHRQTMGGYKLVGCKKESTTPGKRALSAASFAYDGMTLDSCMKNCTGYAYWGAEYGRECYCGNSLDPTSVDATLAECNMACSGDKTQYCGAGDRLELYSTTASQPTPTATLAPKATVSPYVRVGCYHEVNGRALKDAIYADNAMTLEMCATKCSGFTYFAAEYGRECYCGNTLSSDSPATPDGDCDMVCAGNQYEYCGAGDRLELYKLPVSSSSSSVRTTTTSSAAISLRSTVSSGSVTSSSVASSSTNVPSSTASSTTSSSTPSSSPPSSMTLSTSTRTTSSSATMSLYHRPTVSSYSLVGCWTEATGGHRALSAKSTSSTDSMSLETCAAFCAAYHYFGTEYSGECYCGNSLDATSNATALSDCYMPCTGNKYQYCGGPARLELYYASVTDGPAQPLTVTAGSSSWSWSGCRTESASDVRALAAASFAADDMTLEKCAGFCAPYKYFGAEYGRECYCGDSFTEGSVAAPAGDCSMPCAGNVKEFCGAGNRLSVYSKSAS